MRTQNFNCHIILSPTRVKKRKRMKKGNIYLSTRHGSGRSHCPCRGNLRTFDLHALHVGNTVTQRQCNALGLRADADVTAQLAIRVLLLLHGHVHQRIFAEHRPRVQVRRQEVGV